MRFKFVSIFVVMIAVAAAAVIAADAAKKDEAQAEKTACGAETCPKGKEACDAQACPAEGKEKCDKDCDKCGTAECPKVLATVNGEAITVAEADEKLAPSYENVKKQGRELTDEMKNRGRRQVAEQMITEMLVADAIEKEGIEVKKEEIDSKIAEVAARQNMSAEEFLKMLDEQGVSADEFKKRAKLGTAFEKLMEKASAEAKLAVTEEEAKEIYLKQPVQVRASHILIDTREMDEEGKAEAKKKIEDILGKVKAGEDFAELAHEYSDCPSGQDDPRNPDHVYGDLKFFSKGQMVKPFSDAAFAMEVGEVSDIVKTQFGFHIIKVTDRKEPDMAKFDEAKERIMQQEEQKNKSMFAQKYLSELKQNATIKWNEEYAPPRQQLPPQLQQALQKKLQEEAQKQQEQNK